MTFQQKLEALLNFGVTQVIPVVVKNPATQDKVGGYVGLGIAGLALIEALLSHTPTATTPAPVPITIVPGSVVVTPVQK